MADAKTEYSNAVEIRKNEALQDIALANKIQLGFERKKQYGDNWSRVNLNDVVNELTPDAKPSFRDGKIILVNKEHTLAIVMDISGYMRVQDLTQKTKRRQYLGIHGENVHNQKDINGKIHGLSKSEFNRITHFIIKKREEM